MNDEPIYSMLSGKPTVVTFVGGSGTETINGNSYVLFNYGNNENTLNWEIVSPCTANCCGANHDYGCGDDFFGGIEAYYSYDNSTWTIFSNGTGSNISGGNYPPPAASPSGIVYLRIRAEEPFGPYAYAKLT